MLLIFATRYDEVTERTHVIAQRLLAEAAELHIQALPLFEELAVEHELLAALTSRPKVLAFYGHGDQDGSVLTQRQAPCWTVNNIPNLTGMTVYAHACRALRWLCAQHRRHGARLLVGYEIDLITPKNGSKRFWEVYGEIHSFVPRQLARDEDEEQIQRSFYNQCTYYFNELNGSEARLVEVIAVMQSRDYLKFVFG